MRCQIGAPYIARNYRGTSYLFCDVFEGWAELSQPAEHCRRTLRFTAVLAVNAHAVVCSLLLIRAVSRSAELCDEESEYLASMLGIKQRLGSGHRLHLL